MGSVVVSSERPFGATTSVRDYEAHTARLIRVFSPGGKAQFRKPRGLHFGPGGHLYCAAHDEVVGFDFETGPCLGAAVTSRVSTGRNSFYSKMKTLTSKEVAAGAETNTTQINKVFLLLFVHKK